MRIKSWVRRAKLTAVGLAAALALAACATATEETRIATAVHASDYNGIGSQYMERPTFASLMHMSDNRDVLQLKMDAYGSDYDPTTGLNLPHRILFEKTYVGDYLPLIDKYVEWEALARERGDLVEREIGRASTWSGLGGTAQLKFEMFSSNASTHLLVVSFCAAGTCSDKSLSFNRTNVEALRSLLVKFRDGQLASGDLNQVYK